LRERNDAACALIHPVHMMQAISRNDTVAEILARGPEAARVLLDRGMHCVGCAITRFETIAEACVIYGVAIEPLLLDLARATESERRDQS
jgi:hybrid cluster-associated redox disulfide protein